MSELTAEPGVAMGHFEVDWESAEVVVTWSQEAAVETAKAMTTPSDRGPQASG